MTSAAYKQRFILRKIGSFSSRLTALIGAERALRPIPVSF